MLQEASRNWRRYLPCDSRLALTLMHKEYSTCSLLRYRKHVQLSRQPGTCNLYLTLSTRQQPRVALRCASLHLACLKQHEQRHTYRAHPPLPTVRIALIFRLPGDQIVLLDPHFN